MNAVPEQELPQTSCSNCQTLFEVSRELLRSSDTRVRCGECLSIFDALANLRHDDQLLEDDDFLVDTDGNIVDTVSMPGDMSRTDAELLADEIDYHRTSGLSDASAAALAGLGNDTSALDVTYSDFNLFSEDAELPEVAYFDQTQDEVSYRFDEDESLSDSLFARDMTIDLPESDNTAAVGGLTALVLNKEVDFVTSDSPRDPLVFNYRDKEPVNRGAQDHESISEIDAMIERVRSGGPTDYPPSEEVTQAAWKQNPWLLRGSVAAVAVLLMGLLFAYNERDALFASPSAHPLLSGICSLLPCDVPSRNDLNAFRTVKRAAFSHPNIDNALIIDIAFVNEAAFSQPYPVLELQLTDVTGRLVVKNNFTPAEYLGSWDSSDQLASGERLNVSLTVEDPGRDVTSFVVGFR